jgi:hypothetical protein
VFCQIENNSYRNGQAVPLSRRIDVSLVIAKAFGEIGGVEGSLQGSIKVDGTFV